MSGELFWCPKCRKYTNDFIKKDENGNPVCFSCGNKFEFISQKKTTKKPSKFLKQFIHDQWFGLCMGSGDDGYYVAQCVDYFENQLGMWIEFEKQVRKNENKNVIQKLQDLNTEIKRQLVYEKILLDDRIVCDCDECRGGQEQLFRHASTHYHHCVLYRICRAIELSFKELEKLIKEVEK